MLGGASRLVNFISTFDVNIKFNTEEQYSKFNDMFSKLHIYKTATDSFVKR